MKVFDLDLYRRQKVIRESIQALETKIGALALKPGVGVVGEIKTCFKEWLRVKQFKN